MLIITLKKKNSENWPQLNFKEKEENKSNNNNSPA